MQPRPDRIPRTKLTGPANQDQERCLECVVNIGRIGKHAAADSQDHRTMPGHQGLERNFVTTFQVSLEKLPLGESENGISLEDANQVRGASR